MQGPQGLELPSGAAADPVRAATATGTASATATASKMKTKADAGEPVVPAEHRRLVDVTRDKPVKVTVRVVVPTRDHPKFNFVGKLLGPQGNSLKRLQEETMTKMAILGRGSMRDRQKEEELRVSGDPKFSHLQLELHVEVTALAPPAEAHARIALALAEVRRFLVPDFNDDIRQEQMWELHMLKSSRDHVSDNGAAASPTAIPAAAAAAAKATCATVAGSLPESDPIAGVAAAVDLHDVPAASPQLSFTVAHPLTRPMVAPIVSDPSLRLLSSRAVMGSATGAVCTTGGGGRKRPYVAMSPTKRTVLSILARARAAQGKDVNVCSMAPGPGQGIGAH